jgi:phosphatidylinositol-3-phosphatase
MLRRTLLAGAVAFGGLGAVACGVGATAASPAATATRAAASPMCGTLKTAPTYKHVIWILEENTSYSSIVGSSDAPYINSVVKACGVASNYHNISHDSLDNYIGLTNGYTLSELQPYLNDCSPGPGCMVTSGGDLFSQVAAKTGGWKAFDESMPKACSLTDSGNYYVKHNPAVYFTDAASSCKADDLAIGSVKSSPLLKEFASESTAPAFAFITPNICHDMHGALNCFLNLTQAGDTWLKTWLPKITATAVYKSHDTAIVIVWDEGAGGTVGENCATNTTDQSCHVPAIVIAPSVNPGTVVSTLFNHYSLLKTTEDLLGVPELGLGATATSMASGFNL